MISFPGTETPRFVSISSTRPPSLHEAAAQPSGQHLSPPGSQTRVRIPARAFLLLFRRCADCPPTPFAASPPAFQLPSRPAIASPARVAPPGPSRSASSRPSQAAPNSANQVTDPQRGERFILKTSLARDFQTLIAFPPVLEPLQRGVRLLQFSLLRLPLRGALLLSGFFGDERLRSPA